MSVIEKVRQLLLPRVEKDLAAAEQRVAVLQAEVEATALAEFLDDAKAAARHRKARHDLDEAVAAVARLRLAREQATLRDQRTEADAELEAMRAGMAEFEKVMEARKAAAADIDAAVTSLADAYFRLKAGTQLVQMTIPDGLQLPRGYVGRDLKKLIAHALHKASRVAAIGDEGLPGAAAPSISAQFNAPAIPTSEMVIREECDWLISSLQRQIEARARRDGEAA